MADVESLELDQSANNQELPAVLKLPAVQGNICNRLYASNFPKTINHLYSGLASSQVELPQMKAKMLGDQILQPHPLYLVHMADPMPRKGKDK
ncbi:hypothetical protein RRG08_059504, partial [Elysia crispata]